MSCDLILNTVPVKHQILELSNLLDYNGTMVLVGLIPEPQEFSQLQLLLKRRSIAGSHIGGIKNTEECLNLCEKANILPDVEMITAD
mmetsp:Transcript_11207/g.18858  ORF Transcript_11207/g.18858 Transcript_11207/m.18858 type:complete len:87 (+) Transcript_11207:1740-2000(+)